MNNREPRLGEPKCLYEEKLSPLPGLPYLSRWVNSSTRAVSSPSREYSYKQFFEFFNADSKKLTRPG